MDLNYIVVINRLVQHEHHNLQYEEMMDKIENSDRNMNFHATQPLIVRKAHTYIGTLNGCNLGVDV